MAKYVLVSDTTLSREYNDFPLLDFLPCAPSDIVPGTFYRFLKGKAIASQDGRAVSAPYSLRKLEAGLLARNRPEDVVISHEDYVDEFVKEDTEVIGVYTMDPLGLGPLTMSYSVLFGSDSKPWVRVDFERLMRKLNVARRGKKAKIVVGGPGVWEFTIMPELMTELGIDIAFQGEADDIINDLFQDIGSGAIYDGDYFTGFQSFDGDSRKVWVAQDRFVTRRRLSKQFPSLEEIPLIQGPTVKGLVEVMRGCGIGCDFCEVTLRPLRYYSPEMVAKEVAVNARAGGRHAWLHSDEIFAYQHGPRFEPNGDAILGLFRAVMSVGKIGYSNPTHGRISIPAGYPELVQKISEVVRAGPSRWIGMQVGLETGSDRLAMVHMPNKTLPLKIGPDGSWKEIVAEGVRAMNASFWRPAFTVQVGQLDERPDDNWETVAMVNRLSNMKVNGLPAEFTVTPMQNVPLGLIKSRKLTQTLLDESQLAVYYACYLHLAKIVRRNAVVDSKGNMVRRTALSMILSVGGYGLLNAIERICKKRGVDPERVKRYGLD